MHVVMTSKSSIVCIRNIKSIIKRFVNTNEMMKCKFVSKIVFKKRLNREQRHEIWYLVCNAWNVYKINYRNRKIVCIDDKCKKHKRNWLRNERREIKYFEICLNHHILLKISRIWRFRIVCKFEFLINQIYRSSRDRLIRKWRSFLMQNSSISSCQIFTFYCEFSI